MGRYTLMTYESNYFAKQIAERSLRLTDEKIIKVLLADGGDWQKRWEGEQKIKQLMIELAGEEIAKMQKAFRDDIRATCAEWLGEED